MRRSRRRIAAASIRTATWALQNRRLENQSGAFIATSHSHHAARTRSFCALDHAANFLQVFFANAARFHEMDEKGLGGAVEKAIHEFADHFANDLLFAARGTIDVSAIEKPFFQIALGFED